MFLTENSATETVVPDAKFLKRRVGERFEVVARITPLRRDDLVEFRDDTCLIRAIESDELPFGAIGQFPLASLASLVSEAISVL